MMEGGGLEFTHRTMINDKYFRYILWTYSMWVFSHICQILDALIIGFFFAQAMLTEWLVAYCEHTGVFTAKLLT